MISIDKVKAIRKWMPIVESLKVTDEKKIELLSIYGEYRNIVQSASRAQGFSNLNLPSEFKILSDAKLENKAIIMSGLNDDKIKFINPHPMAKFTLTYEEIDTDIKLARKNKINAINGNFSPPTGMSFVQRMDSNLVALIISDINERLKALEEKKNA